MSDVRLTDDLVRRLEPAERGKQYLVRDSELPGFFVVVGARAKTFTVQRDIRQFGKRRTVKRTLGRFGLINCKEARAKAKRELLDMQDAKARREQVTLGQAWDRYRESHLKRQERSPRTVLSYSASIDVILKDWLDVPLVELSQRPDLVAARHDEITRRNGPFAANRTMRVLRAVYRYARKRMDRTLPGEHPASAVDMNPEPRRQSGMGSRDLPGWWEQLRAIENPIRREFHLMTLLSGSRPDALRQAKWEHLDTKRRVLHIPSPKGGPKRAFDLPLSRIMLASLARARRAGRSVHRENAQAWIFPADTSQGCIVEWKEPRSRLEKWGSDLRQTYRTLAVEVGIADADVMMLMNHRVPGVSGGYITRGALVAHLQEQQERLSRFIWRALRQA